MDPLFNKVYSMLTPMMQNVVISAYGYKIKKERFCDQYYQYLGFLEKSQYYSLDELNEYQNEKLRNIVKYSYENVPYYNNLFKTINLVPKDIKSKEDLNKLSILTKEDIKRNFNKLISRKHKRQKLRTGHTSGTTGSPLEVLWDHNVEVITNAILWRHRRWAGFEFGSKYATLLGRVIVPPDQKCPPFYRRNVPWNQFLFSSFHLIDDNIKYYFDEFDKNNIRFLEAYPSTAYILAQYLKQHNLYYNMNAIVTSSETLLPLQREIIEERFGCKVFDYYGMAERVMFSGECEAHNGHHIDMEFGITEILDDNNNSVPDGDSGRLVLTGLHNFGMPLIRYDIGDVSAFKIGKCSCGRNLVLLENIATKSEDIVVTRDGRLISSSVLTHPFKPMNNIEKSQIIQVDYEHLVIKIVRKPGYSDEDTKVLREGIQERIGQQMNISIEFVSDIPRSANGKYRWVISKVPINFGDNRIKNLYDK